MSSMEGRGWPDGKELKQAIESNGLSGSCCPRYIPSTRTITKKQLLAMMNRGHWDAIGKVFDFKPKFLFNEAERKVFDWTSCPPEMVAVLQRSNKSPSPKLRIKYKSSKTTRTKLHEAQGGRCYYCGRIVNLGAFSTDHVIPKCRGGQKGSNNTVGSCKSCNNAKGNMTLTEFLETDYLPNERRTLLGFPDEPVSDYQQARDGHGKRIGDYWTKLLT